MPILILTLVFVGLMLPSLVVGMQGDALPAFVLSGLFWTLLLSVLLWVPGTTRWLRLVCLCLFWPLFMALMVLRWLWALVRDFSGEGFTSHFFAHASDEAIRVGISQYFSWLMLALLAGAILTFVIARISRRATKGNLAGVGVLLLSAACLAVAGLARGPETEALVNYRLYQALVNPGTLSPLERKQLEESGLVAMSGTRVTGLSADASERPLNLVLVYLESFHLAFTDAGQLDDLTPGLNRLKRQYGHHPQWLSSADATMEGLISTLCGTLVASAQGSSGFVNREAILPDLTCLPDVLGEAGYHQVYMGGFDKSFSGKGLFLSGHGYDEVWGWEDWSELGLEAPVRNWGLSDDQLFEQALEKVRSLSGDPLQQPFQLTLLTLATHPPGFPAPSCQPYPKAAGSRLVQAIHCTDKLVSGFVDQLQNDGLLENTLLVITGDHDMFNLPEIQQTFPDLASDPRLLHIAIAPGGLVAWPEHPAIAADLAPTLLDQLRIEHNAQFMWGRSVWEPRDYLLTRNFRLTAGGNLEFLDRSKACPGSETRLEAPLDDCTHQRLLRLSDRYLYGFYGEQAAPLALCDQEHPFRLSVSAEMGFSLQSAGEQQDQLFIHRGRLMKADEPGFYLYIKPSRTRVAGHYFYSLDHIYRQIKLTELLLSLEVEDQFVLAYLPGQHPGLIEPLAAWLGAMGLAEPDLNSSFALVSNGEPRPGQVFQLDNAGGQLLELTPSECLQIAESGQRQPALLDRPDLKDQLQPLLQEYPDL